MNPLLALQVLQLRELCARQEKIIAAKTSRIADLEGGTGERSLGQELLALEATVADQRQAHSESMRAAALQQEGMATQMVAIEARHDKALIAVAESHKDSTVGQLTFYLSEAKRKQRFAGALVLRYSVAWKHRAELSRTFNTMVVEWCKWSAHRRAAQIAPHTMPARAEVVLNMEYQAVGLPGSKIRNKFKNLFAADISKVLGIDATAVSVGELQRGSICVGFEILQDFRTPSQLREQLVRAAQDGASGLYNGVLTSKMDPARSMAALDKLLAADVVEMGRRRNSASWSDPSMTLADANTQARLLREEKSQAELKIEDLESQVRVLRQKAALGGAGSPSKAKLASARSNLELPVDNARVAKVIVGEYKKQAAMRMLLRGHRALWLVRQSKALRDMVVQWTRGRAPPPPPLSYEEIMVLGSPAPVAAPAPRVVVPVHENPMDLWPWMDKYDKLRGDFTVLLSEKASVTPGLDAEENMAKAEESNTKLKLHIKNTQIDLGDAFGQLKQLKREKGELATRLQELEEVQIEHDSKVKKLMLDIEQQKAIELENQALKKKNDANMQSVLADLESAQEELLNAGGANNRIVRLEEEKSAIQSQLDAVEAGKIKNDQQMKLVLAELEKAQHTNMKNEQELARLGEDNSQKQKNDAKLREANSVIEEMQKERLKIAAMTPEEQMQAAIAAEAQDQASSAQIQGFLKGRQARKEVALQAEQQ